MRCLFVVIVSFMATSFLSRTCDATQCKATVNSEGECHIFGRYFSRGGGGMLPDLCVAVECRQDGSILVHGCRGTEGTGTLKDYALLNMGPVLYPGCCKNCTAS
uniref:8.9 kDa family member n=1 Tax=Rhipicephalus zambeziensis TaxID=60191 RepID=A0A224Y9Y2_9ACAR